MKQTLLDLVQDILSDIDGDEVNSIFDTEESEQVARQVRAAYRGIVSGTTWPHTRRIVSLIPRSNSSLPTHMSVRENFKELISVRYDKSELGDSRKDYKEVKFLDPDQFLVKLNLRDNSDEDVETVVDDSGIELFILNNKAPEYFTSFNDEDLVFDSYDSEVDSTLRESKLQVQAYIIPEFSLLDTYTPDLPADAFSLLYEESVSRCQLKLRQFQDAKSESESTIQSRRMSRKNWTVSGGVKYPNYGRHR